jgi:transposase
MGAELKRMLAENVQLREQVQELQARVLALENENRDLKQKNSYLINQVFGRRSEILNPNQLEFLLGLPKTEIYVEPPVVSLLPVKTQSRRVRKARKFRLPEDLPTEDIIIDPKEVIAFPEAYRYIGEEITRELDVILPKYFLRRFIRRKYMSKANRNQPPLLGELPPRLIEGGYASAGLLTDIVLKKYVDHLPLYRQEQILRSRYGIELPRKTMADWMRVTADWLSPIYRHIRDGLKKSGYLQIDETPVRYCLAEGGGSGQGYFWVYHHPPLAGRPGGEVLYEWHTGRGTECLDKMLDDFAGKVQCDGYGAYGSYAKDHKKIVLAACWAHARRKFFEAREESPRFAGFVLNQIGHLYKIEEELRTHRAGPRLRHAVRAAQSGMILERIHRVLLRKRTLYLPQGQMGKAIAYALGLWEELMRFRDDGRLEIDNNLVENAIRPTAVGKKNWLFIGHPEAGDRSAIIYTLLENCKRLGINPQEYLHDVLTKLPSMTNMQTHELTPVNWLAAHKKKVA